MKLPRLVAFDADGKAICAGCPAEVQDAPRKEVVMLPSDGPEFITVTVKGKTREEIDALPD